MKIVLQRVLEAEVAVDGRIIGSIDRGFLVFLGVAATDSQAQVHVLADKLTKLRIFADENGKSNLSIGDVGGEILIISQFTLCADTRKGNRPSFIHAAPPQPANALYEYFIKYCQGKFAKVVTGSFGADMKVSLVNDGPYTVILEAE